MHDEVDPLKSSKVGQHKSVFERLSYGNVSLLKKDTNYASMVGGNVCMTDLKFFPFGDKLQSTISIPVELAKEASQTYKSTLYGYFLGSRIPFPMLVKHVKQAWGKFGFVDAMLNEKGFFFFKFNDVGGCNQVIEQGPLMVKGVPLFVYHWDPTKGLSRSEHNSCPLWVLLHNVPLVAFNKEGIGRISSALGIPKQMDACTASMCDKKWGRPGFAKVLIDVWAVGKLKKELEVVIPSLDGGNDEKVKVQVEYLWEPLQCSHCNVFGHKVGSCIKAVAAGFTEHTNHKQQVDAEGFTKVVRKQWKRKENQNRTQSLDTNVKSGDDGKESSRGKKEQIGSEVGEKGGDVGGGEEPSHEVESESNSSKTAPEVIGDRVVVGKTKTFDGKGDAWKSPMPFYQTVLKSFQPKRGAPLSNMFDSLACDLDSEDDEEAVDGKDPCGFEKEEEVENTYVSREGKEVIESNLND